jgi:hypothetical protein
VLCAVLVLGLCSLSWGQGKATAPDPADGALDVVVPLLKWTPAPGTLVMDLYLGARPNLGAADLVQGQNPSPLYYHGPGFEPGAVYYWRVDTVLPDGTVIEGDVWSFQAQALTAYHPSPADEGSAPLTPLLTWLPGQNAEAHHVYFSADEAAVADGAAEADKGVTEDPNYAPEPLAPVTTYYWRVDEVLLDGTEVAGPVWSFTTILPIDDFESYTNEVGERIFEVWVDGIGFTLPEPGSEGNGTNAAVGHDIWAVNSPYTTLAETTIVHSGDQSMPLYYSNAESPYISEAHRTWAAPQDWTIGGVDTMTLNVQGLAADIVIPRVDTPPVIDGEVDAVWEMASVQEITIPINTAPSGPDDSSGSFRLLYDAENLFLLAEVTDESLINDTAASWQDDSVEFYFDGENSKGPQGLSGNDRQITFGWTTEEVQGTNQNDEGFELAQMDTATGWRLEVKMPWQSLMSTEAPAGQLIGVDCFINDDDDGDTRDSQIAWHATEAVGWETPSMWGTALVAAPAAAGAADRLYVKVQDTANQTAVVTHPDPGVLGTTSWAEWKIALGDIEAAGVNLTAVSKMILGIGNPDAASPGAGGVLFVDDIYLSTSPPVPTLTLAPTDVVEATGDSGEVLTINGVAVADLILGTTTYAGVGKHSQYPQEDADDFDLATPASADDQEYIQTVFDQPVSTIFILERGANDSGYIQALDADGNVAGDKVPFTPDDFAMIGYKALGNQDGGGLVIASDMPIYGIRIFPPDDGPLGIDPASVSAVPAE